MVLSVDLGQYFFHNIQIVGCELKGVRVPIRSNFTGEL